jgi:hypothetical protein
MGKLLKAGQLVFWQLPLPKNPSRLDLSLHRSVPSPPASLTGVGRSREPDLCVEFLIRLIFSVDYVRVFIVVFASASMEMTLSIISDLRLSIRRRDLLPDGNGGVRRLQFSRYGPPDLALPDQFWKFSHGCREACDPRNICPGCYVLDNGDSYPRLPNNVDQAVRLFCPGILVLVLLPMLIDYFNGYTRARSLGITAQIKIMRESSLVFTG